MHAIAARLGLALTEQPLEIPVDGGVLVGHRGGGGPPAAAPPPDYSVGGECSRDTNESILEHFGRGTLATGLASSDLPMLFLHGELDPMPLSSVEQTAALVPGAQMVTIPRCGHFPWWEAPGEIQRAVARFLAARG